MEPFGQSNGSHCRREAVNLPKHLLHQFFMWIHMLRCHAVSILEICLIILIWNNLHDLLAHGVLSSLRYSGRNASTCKLTMVRTKQKMRTHRTGEVSSYHRDFGSTYLYIYIYINCPLHSNSINFANFRWVVLTFHHIFPICRRALHRIKGIHQRTPGGNDLLRKTQRLISLMSRT